MQQGYKAFSRSEYLRGQHTARDQRVETHRADLRLPGIAAVDSQPVSCCLSQVSAKSQALATLKRNQTAW